MKNIYEVVAESAAKEQAAADAAAKAEAEKNAANEAVTKAEAEKNAANEAATKAEAEKAAAEAAKTQAETDRKAAEEAKAKAEADKKAAEEAAQNATQNAAAESSYVKQTAAKINSITVEWSADDDADAGYRIYIKNSTSKKYTKVADVSAAKTSYTIKKAGGKKLTAGGTYYVQVVSLQKVDGKKTEISSCITKAVTITAKPKISSTKRAKSSITLKWKKVTGANGYEIQMSTKKKSGYETVATVSSAKKSYKVTGLARKTNYYFRIRTYKTVNGVKYYSSWSTAKKAKTK